MSALAGGKVPRAIAGAVLAIAGPASARQDPPAWTRPTAPFHVVGNIWYVGTEGLAAYAIKTRGGTMLLDATMDENVPAILANLRAIGVAPGDVKTILVSHAHFDHAAGDAAMKRATGATLLAGARDVAALESGDPPGETLYPAVRFPAVKVDREVRDGDRVVLGETVMTAVATAGHTPGCTTWTMRTVETGRRLAVVFPCSISVAGNRLVGNARYPGIVADFRRSFARLGALKADVVLPAHPEIADVMPRKAAGGGLRFVDASVLGRLVAKARVAFDADLARQRKPI